MKKLMIAAAVVCAAAISQAAVANWKGSASAIYDGTGSTETTAKYAGTAYIFDAGVTSQAALFQMVLDGDTIGSSTAGYMATATVANGGFSGVTWTNGEQGDGKTYNYYFAIVEDDKVYFSNLKGNTPNASSSAKNIGFGIQFDDENPSAIPNSVNLPTDGYVGAGQWASVPEPTSGLLLLLGVAGLALKRKRA